MAPPSLLTLPEEVIAHLMALADQRTRLALELTCRKLRAISTDPSLASSIWRAVEFAVDTGAWADVGRHSVLAFLRRHAVVRELRYCVSLMGDDEDEEVAEAEEGMEAQVFFGLLTASLAALAPALERLQLEWPRELAVHNWPEFAPGLIALEATAPAGVRMLADLGGLSRLQALTLRAGHCFLSPYLRLPSSLTMLEILAKSVQVWEDEGGASRADLSNLSRLERLVLQHEAALQSMRPLSRLGRLQTLLLRCVGPFPTDLVALTGLTRLGLRCNMLRDPEKLGQALEAMPELRQLSLRSTRLEGLLVAPSALPRLQELRLLHNPNLHTFPSGAYWPTLERLAVGAELLLRQSDVLEQATALQTLVVHGVDGMPQSLAPRVPQAAAVILGLQRLRHVRLETAGASVAPTVLELVLALGERRPGLVEIDTTRPAPGA